MSRIRGGASRIIEGIQLFQERVFGTKESLFQQLGQGQSPLALFITCSDSRINPNLLTQTEPGELFILRTAGNLVPPFGSPPSGEEATIEYALKQLHIRDVILCGHSCCGAMQALLAPDSLRELPGVAQWLTHARDVLPEVDRLGADLPPSEKLLLAIERNVLVQMEHIRSFPCVQEALTGGRLRLHAWVYHFETGHVTAHDPGKERFVPLIEAPRQKWLVQVPGGAVDRGVLGDSI
jgi:carbonic anhydrase